MITFLMTFDNVEILGSTALALSSILSLYLLIKQVVQYEKPKNSKNVPATELDSLKTYTLGLFQNVQQSVGQWRSEMKDEYKHLYSLISRLHADFHRFTNKNTEQITELTAQNNFQQDKINELTTRNEKIIERIFSKNK
jgi:biopolymer transport protein ExbB/TolQ